MRSRFSVIVRPMLTSKRADPAWELTILDADLRMKEADEGTHSFCAIDLDGDGHVETFVGGKGALAWNRPATGERGVVDSGLDLDGMFGVGLIAVDLFGDGRPVLVTGSTRQGDGHAYWLRPKGGVEGEWELGLIDGKAEGMVHDVVAADLDGDGELELVVNAIGWGAIGLYIHDRQEDGSWTREAVQVGRLEEGLCVADFDGDGVPEIASGVRVYKRDGDGWQGRVAAPTQREMCRCKAVDVTGNGRPDLVIVDSEYYKGTLSWCELTDDGWVDHEIDHGLYYPHSLVAERDGDTVRLTVAEMFVGGWGPDRNYDAHVYRYESTDNGKTWSRTLLHEGQGTHEAEFADVGLGGGGKSFVGKEFKDARITAFTPTREESPLARMKHRFLDRDKPEVGTEIVCCDVTGDGVQDVACASWWYRVSDGRRFHVPGVGQIINAFDVDGDGRDELLVTLRNGDKTGYDGLTAELAIAKAVDPEREKWDVIPIGKGTGDWPHGNVFGNFVDGGPAVAACYHSAHSWGESGLKHFPEIWRPDGNPLNGNWRREILAEINYGEELLLHDVTDNGVMDIVAGCWWLENLGGGRFEPREIVARDAFYPARCAMLDVTGDGHADLVCAEEVMDYETKTVPWSPLVWFERPGGGDPRDRWTKHVIDHVRCGHSIGAADLDGDGVTELVVGEHYPFHPFRSRCRLYVYKPTRLSAGGLAWKRWTLDDRFEHHDGCKILDLGSGKKGVVSHAWQEAGYVHLWEPGR